ncbi:hypothetical protein HBI18_009020 [Parastagonospora nodorum]|nr:hypothetical protein HBH51_129290 [Parastagonospora nodorum]KAH5623456.1 hypothetical protein HBI22_175790 [Parastagonospora nodorum]KAH5746725.1 hypothetical protein HBI18_009020 [Parastagonospora nodorum]
MSWTRPGVPTTTWGPSWRAFMSSRTLVPPMQAWQATSMKSPMATTTFWICWASSRVGARMSAWQALTLESIFWRVEMEKVAVFPVPDCACAMTSWPGTPRRSSAFKFIASKD